MDAYVCEFKIIFLCERSILTGYTAIISCYRKRSILDLSDFPFYKTCRIPGRTPGGMNEAFARHRRITMSMYVL